MRLSAEELDALPAGSAVIRGGAEAFIAHDAPHRVTTRFWGTSQSAGMFSSQWIADGGAELFWKAESA